MVRRRIIALTAILLVFIISANSDFAPGRALAVEKRAKSCGQRAAAAPPKAKQAREPKLPAAVDEEFAKQFILQIIGALVPSNPAPPTLPAQTEKSGVDVAAHNNQLTIRTTLNGAILETVTGQATFEVAGFNGRITAANNRVKFQFAGGGTTGGGTTGDGEAGRAFYDNVEGAIELEGHVVFNLRRTNGGSTSMTSERLHYSPIKRRLSVSGGKAEVSSEKH